MKTKTYQEECKILKEHLKCLKKDNRIIPKNDSPEKHVEIDLNSGAGKIVYGLLFTDKTVKLKWRE